MWSRTRYRLLIAAAVFAVLPRVTAQEEELEVRKSARRENPALRITQWQGNREVLAHLQQDLKYSDWFRFPVKEGEKTAYQLTGTAKPAGNKIALTLELTGDGTTRTLALAHPNAVRLAHAAVDQLIKAAFDNPGWCSSRLAFVKRAGKGKDIWVSDFHGGHGKPLVRTGTIATEPAWSNDGRYLTFTLYTGLSTDVLIMDFKRERHKRIAGYGGLNAGCDLSNRATHAALTLSKGGKQVDLFVQDIRTDEIVQLTNDDHVEASPCWSPDDSQICYVSDRGRRPTLHLINADGGQPTRLSPTLGEAVAPDWSPVSNQICFALRRGGHYAIGIIDMDRPQAPERVPVRLAGDWEAPCWAADGRHIICSRDLNGTKNLYVIDSWYGRARKLMAGDGVSLPASTQ